MKKELEKRNGKYQGRRIKNKMTDNKDSNPDSPFTSGFSQEQAITTNSGPARIEKFIARLPKGLRKKTTNCPDKTDAA